MTEKNSRLEPRTKSMCPFVAAMPKPIPDPSVEVVLPPNLNHVYFAEAALATLAADRFGDVQGLYTFGSPLVGDEGFARDFHVSAYRFVNNNDVVARIPPWGPNALKLVKWGRYEHVGLLKYIDEAGRFFDNPSMLERMQHGVGGQIQLLRDLMGRWANGEFGDLPIDGFIDHAPLYYVLRIWNCYEHEFQGF